MFWKIFFWIYLIVTLVSFQFPLLLVITNPVFIFDILFSLFNLLVSVGLYIYAYNRRVFSHLLWKVVFIVLGVFLISSIADYFNLGLGSLLAKLNVTGQSDGSTHVSDQGNLLSYIVLFLYLFPLYALYRLGFNYQSRQPEPSTEVDQKPIQKEESTTLPSQPSGSGEYKNTHSLRGRIHLVIIIVTIAAAVAFFRYAEKHCTDGFLISCGMGLSFLFYLGVAILVSFIVISTVLWKIFLHKKGASVKRILVIYGLSYLVTFGAPVITDALSTGLGVLVALPSYLQFKNLFPSIESNYTIVNFSEQPVIDESSQKYLSLEVLFDVEVEKSGHYDVATVVSSSTSPWDTHPYFGHEGYPYNEEGSFEDVYIAEDTPHHFSFQLFPKRNLQEKKPDGPYYFTIIFDPHDDAKYHDRDRGLVITGDTSMRDWYKEHSFDILVTSDERLISQKYQFEDFLLEGKELDWE